MAFRGGHGAKRPGGGGEGSFQKTTPCAVTREFSKNQLATRLLLYRRLAIPSFSGDAVGKKFPRTSSARDATTRRSFVTNTAGRRRSGAKSSQPATSKSLSRAERGRRKKQVAAEQRPAQTKKRDAEGIYRPTPHEQSALRRYLTLTENTAPRLKVLTDGDVLS